PSTHGVLRLKLTLDGEWIREVEPVIGYLHRSFEKMAERERWAHFIVDCNRADYAASLHYEAAYVKAVEELLEMEPPPRAQFIRVILLEFDRIQSHLLWLGTFGLDVGALNAFWYCFRERDLILNLLRTATGARMHHNYNRFGGVKADLPEGFVEEAHHVLDTLERKIEEYADFLSRSDTFLMRTVGVGVLPREMAIDWGVTGPMLRASGVRFDLRQAEPYFAYGEVDFDIPVEEAGDVYARYLVRLEEMRQSCRIVRQALKKMPEGPVIVEGMEKGNQLLVKPEGEHYSRIEGPRGEIGIYIIGNGTTFPYRVKLRSPSFQNLSVFPELARGLIIPDLVATNGSIDLCMACVDR
ncbi:MAG: NADH-quinone oxidoreductase subunit D, partial [Candidatus Bipolaricaulia bacterium]